MLWLALVGIVGVELKVNLEPKGQIEDLSTSRDSRKPASQSEWVPAVVSFVEKGSSPSEGDLARCVLKPPKGILLDPGEKASWSFSGCLEEESEKSKWMEGATLWVLDWRLKPLFFCYQVIFM